MSTPLSKRALEALLSRMDAGDSDRVVRGDGDIESILRTVTSSRWRRSSLSALSASDTRRKVEDALRARRPLTFSIPFGGYKSWRIESSPLPNWAEIFFLDHLRSYLRDISSTYPYGVRAEFTYLSNVMDLVSNHEPTWQAQYVQALRELLRYMADEPEQLSVVDITSLHPEVAVRDAVLANFEQVRHEWSGNLDAVQQSKLVSANRNFYPGGPRPVVDGELEARELESAMLCDALDSLDIRRAYNKFGHRIQLVFGNTPQPAIHIATTKMSTTHFWVSEGCLEWNGKDFYPTMVGHTALPRRGEMLEVPDVASFRSKIGEWVPAACEVR